MNPIVHAESSVKHFGGDINDYIHLHEKMDCSKGWIADNRHRVLTHTMFWIKEVMIPIYGSYITNSEGKRISTKDICERHILEDFKMKFIPTPQDFIQEMDFKDWMQNGNGICPSAKKLYKDKAETAPAPVEKPRELHKVPIERLEPLNEVNRSFDIENTIMDGMGSSNIDNMILDGGPNHPRNKRKGKGGSDFQKMILD